MKHNWIRMKNIEHIPPNYKYLLGLFDYYQCKNCSWWKAIDRQETNDVESQTVYFDRFGFNNNLSNFSDVEIAPCNELIMENVLK